MATEGWDQPGETDRATAEIWTLTFQKTTLEAPFMQSSLEHSGAIIYNHGDSN